MSTKAPGSPYPGWRCATRDRTCGALASWPTCSDSPLLPRARGNSARRGQLCARAQAARTPCLRGACRHPGDP
eukprot:10469617-Alexandrium_andersonii.AAC.1